MNCPFCGSPIGSGAASCPNCGAPVSQEPSAPVKKAPAWRPDSVTAQHQERAKNSPPPEPTMFWYYFLIYFGLWFSTAVWGYQGIQDLILYLSGQNQALNIIYTAVPIVKYLNIAEAVCYILLAGYCILSRTQLAAHKASGPKNLQILYGLHLAVSIAFPAFSQILCAANGLDVSVWSFGTFAGIFFSAFIIYANGVYFKKRRKYFNK